MKDYKEMNVYDIGSILLHLIRDEIDFTFEFDGIRYGIDNVSVQVDKIVLLGYEKRAK